MKKPSPTPRRKKPSSVVEPDPRRTIDREAVRGLYVNNGLGCKEIANRLGFSEFSIHRVLRNLKVARHKPDPPLNAKWRSAIYAVWKSIRNRCRNSRHRSFKYYGARGIGICNEWHDSFSLFYRWARSSGYEPRLSIELVNPKKGYISTNCKWIGADEQAERRFELGGKPAEQAITAFGETKGLNAWVNDARCMVSVNTLLHRLENGYPPEVALKTLPYQTLDIRTNPRRSKQSYKVRKLQRIDWNEALRLYKHEGLSLPEVAVRVGANYSSILTGMKSRGVYCPTAPSILNSKQAAPLARIWRHVFERCTNPRDHAYKYYGAKGVTICASWRTFNNFFEWAKASNFKRGMCLARMDTNKGYSPKNCHWLRRGDTTRLSDHPSSYVRPRWIITAFDETKGASAWARDPRCTVRLMSLIARLKRRMPPEEAITLPRRNSGRTAKNLIQIFGESKGLASWAKDSRCKVSITTLQERLHEGFSAEVAIKTRPFKLYLRKSNNENMSKTTKQ